LTPSGSGKILSGAGGKPIYPFTPALRLLIGIPYSDLLRERGKGEGGILPFSRKKINSKIFRACILKVSVERSSRPGLTKNGFLQISLCKQVPGSPDFLPFSREQIS
jgi:hypothetical protein